MKRLRLFLAIVIAMTAAAMSAQLSTATLFGTVTDSTGAVIPNAAVTLTQIDTNFTRTTTTNGQGEYRAEFLPIGSYSARVQAPGFKVMEQKGIALTATQNANLNFELSLGTESTVVEVTSEVPLVNLGNSTLSRTVDNVEVDNLPLVGRNAYRLMDLTPGVQSNTFENTVGFPAQHVIINGSPDDLVGEVSYYLDGGLNMTGLRNTGNALPNPDTIQEFVVQTNNFSAQYGRTGAGIVTVVTKAGTNVLHGSIFEFHRETNFNATSHGQASKTPLHVNNFGATLGGPIIKDKTFLFGSYGGLRQVNPVNFNTVVPDALQRAGNFSENLPTTTPASGLGACATTLNAADKANTAYGGKFFVCDPVTHQPIPGNRADLDANYTKLLDPVAAAVLTKNVPLPTAGRTDNRYIGNIGLPNETNEFLDQGRPTTWPEPPAHSRLLPVEWIAASLAVGIEPRHMGDLQLQLSPTDCQRKRCVDARLCREPGMAQLHADERRPRQPACDVTRRLWFRTQCAGPTSASTDCRGWILHTRQPDQRPRRRDQRLRPSRCLHDDARQAHALLRCRRLS